MTTFFRALGALLLGGMPIRAVADSTWVISSPHHDQTYAFGSERGHQWMNVRGHLAVVLHLTNDPYVDQISPRQYDDFTFDFPDVVLGPEGRTFYYHPPGQARPVAVAARHPGFLGVEEVTLLPSSFLVVEKPHGYLTVRLVADRQPPALEADR